MLNVYRYKLMEPDLWMDTGALPCPRCRSMNFEVTSSAYTGSMATCKDCGARSHLCAWNDGEVQLQRNESGDLFSYAGLKFQRPAEDTIVRTRTGKEAWRLADASARVRG